MLGFHPYFDIRYYADGRVVCTTRRLHFTPKKIPRYSFLLEDERTPGLPNADRRNRSLENFQGPCWESSREPPILYRSALTNCRIHLIAVFSLVIMNIWCRTIVT